MAKQGQKEARNATHGANHVGFLLLIIGFQSSSERGTSWAKELGIRPSNRGGLLRYQAVVSFSSRNQQVFKIKRRRRSLNQKCEKMGIRRNDLEPSCLHTLQSWAQFSSGSLKISCVRLFAEKTCKAAELVKKIMELEFFFWRNHDLYLPFWVGGNTQGRQGKEFTQLHPVLLLQSMLVPEKYLPSRDFKSNEVELKEEWKRLNVEYQK